MRRGWRIVAIAIVAGFAVGFFARPVAMGAEDAPLQPDTRAADLAAIEKLHRADVEATLTQHPSALSARSGRITV